MMHMRDLDKGFVSLAEVASTCGRVRIAATRCQKFMCSTLHEPPARAARIAPTGLHAASEGSTPSIRFSTTPGEEPTVELELS